MPRDLAPYWRIVFWVGVVIVGVLSIWSLDPTPKPEGGDKVKHFAAYAALGFTAAGGWLNRAGVKRGAIALTIGLITTYGLGLEIVQGFVGRQPGLGDLIADAIGAALGVALFFGLASRFPKRV